MEGEKEDSSTKSKCPAQQLQTDDVLGMQANCNLPSGISDYTPTWINTEIMGLATRFYLSNEMSRSALLSSHELGYGSVGVDWG